jgi:hypothetical protein
LAAFLGVSAAGSFWLAGEVDAELAAAVGACAHVTIIEPVHGLRRAGVLAHMAALLLEAGHAETLTSLQPLYLREP